MIGGSDDGNKEKSALEAFKGDEFMELKYRIMKKLEATTKVCLLPSHWHSFATHLFGIIFMIFRTRSLSFNSQ